MPTSASTYSTVTSTSCSTVTSCSATPTTSTITVTATATPEPACVNPNTSLSQRRDRVLIRKRSSKQDNAKSLDWRASRTLNRRDDTTTTWTRDIPTGNPGSNGSWGAFYNNKTGLLSRPDTTELDDEPNFAYDTRVFQSGTENAVVVDMNGCTAIVVVSRRGIKPHLLS